MPNWCYTTVKIEGKDIGKKQFNKLYKLLTDPEMFLIRNIDYHNLMKLDTINKQLGKNRNLIETIDLILKDLFEKDNREVKTCEEIMIHLYDVVRNNKSIINVDMKTLDDNLLVFISSLYDAYKFSSQYTNNEYIKTKIYTTNVFPDNPISTFRYDLLRDEDILIKDIKMFNDIDNIRESRYDRIGCKWNPDTVDLNYDKENKVIYWSCECPWSPCIKFCINLSKLYDVEIEICYSESGMGYTGTSIIYDGEVVSEADYDSTNCVDFKFAEILSFENREATLFELFEEAILNGEFEGYDDLTSEKQMKHILLDESVKETFLELLSDCENIPEDTLKKYKDEIEKMIKPKRKRAVTIRKTK